MARNRKQETFTEKIIKAKKVFKGDGRNYEQMMLYVTPRERQAVVEAERITGASKNRLFPTLCQLAINERNAEKS